MSFSSLAQIAPLTGEFASPGSETAFLHHQQPQTQPLLGFTLAFCTLFYVAFAVTDLAALGFGEAFLTLFSARMVVALTAGACTWLAYRRPLTVPAMRLAASVAEAVALGCFMIIAIYRPAEFHWHAMSLAIMLMVVYLYIPNSFVNTLLLAFSSTAVFVAIALGQGRMNFTDVVTMSMLLFLTNAFGALAARRFNRISREEYRAQVELRHAAERDHLTGCHNRRYLHEKLMTPLAQQALCQHARVAVVLCDIDNFKHINDSHGHADGDEVIRSFARLLAAMTREGLDSVIRYGGEEFLAVLPGATLDEGIALAERLRSRFAAAATLSAYGQEHIRTTASFGVAAGAADMEDGPALRDLIAAADKLMYEAKRGGRDCVRAMQVL
ncbi:sensor domain-containing diguanylate cyclase [Massilia aerilata]|uniref:diguanylate cyclase n=1 Tax=Massilia aerilata TaxID=453817 RepID=A0ABW0S503_9BURK